jgi:hypothetical protein
MSVFRGFRNALVGYECQAVSDAGFAGKRNGELLLLAEKSGFDVFITLDRGIEYQQNLKSRKLVVILIRARSSRIKDLLPCAPDILRLLPNTKPGELVTVG